MAIAASQKATEPLYLSYVVNVTYGTQQMSVAFELLLFGGVSEGFGI